MIGLLLLFICLAIAGIGLYRAERALWTRREAAGDAAEELLRDVEERFPPARLPSAGDGLSADVSDRDSAADGLPSARRLSGDGAALSGDGVRAQGDRPHVRGDGAGPGLGAQGPGRLRPVEDTAPRSILIVDLDKKARERLRATLTGPYAVTEAENAQRAIELLERRLPALAIVATNVRDRHGHPFWEWMRRTGATSQVPLIVVSAVAAGENLHERFEKLSVQPDAVLRKPILIDEVRESVARVLNGVGAGFGDGDWLPSLDSSDEDTRFARRAQEEVERQIGNPAFGVRELSEELGLSARQLQRRLRDTTGLSPNAFIRSIRLQHAVRLLERGSDPVSQIAYSVGFNSLSYFAKCFREHFGRNPSEFTAKRGRMALPS